MRIHAESRAADRHLRRREPFPTRYRIWPDVCKRSMSMNGTSAYGVNDTVAPDLLGDFSVSVWMRVDTASPSASNEALWSLHTAARGNLLIWQVNYGLFPDPTVMFRIWSQVDGAGYPGLAGGINIKDGNWHNMVFTYDATAFAMKVYTDGALELDHTAVGPIGLAADSLVSFGQEWDAGGPSDYFQGWYDGIAYYKRTLTQTDASDLADRIDPRRLGAEHYYMCGDWDRNEHPRMINRGAGSAEGTWVGTAITDIVEDGP